MTGPDGCMLPGRCALCRERARQVAEHAADYAQRTLNADRQKILRDLSKRAT